MPVVWNADNDARLLMAYIEATDAKLGTDGWKAIAEKLGGDTTVGAISQRFTKVLKKKYGGENCVLGSGGDGGGGKTSAPATPAKARGRKKKDTDDPEKTPRSSPRKRGAKDDGAEGEDDDNIPDSPTKKIRSESYFDQDGEDV
ncbi:hypothetical protein BFW01_g10979 [Lasiodiplodia theobromae]|uniref:Myb-like domain-containing protein n=1 Tax=Lasiodiplodia theobromae TaxID=45133 RepID=A0A8H7IQB0_9PEZI|nr:Rna polymerase-associated protein ctr9 [Lasiodiplodia theobromae]KAF4541763.1 Rna polymerase-associated protein ctr9 [Lasiodiplodia theobromae]KAF9629776.1 hypothetical protein BFW01_g10979 [Lasiodiplodia theobromae]